jgi:hypothetical protein
MAQVGQAAQQAALTPANAAAPGNVQQPQAQDDMEQVGLEVAAANQEQPERACTPRQQEIMLTGSTWTRSEGG